MTDILAAADRLTICVDDELICGTHQVLVLDDNEDDQRMAIGQYHPTSASGQLVMEEWPSRERLAAELGVPALSDVDFRAASDRLAARMLSAAIEQTATRIVRRRSA